MSRFVRAFAVLYLLAMAFFAWGWLAVKLQVFPFAHIEPLYAEIEAFFAESHQEKLVDMVKYDHQERKNAFDFEGFRQGDADFSDDGYLLISRYSKQAGQVVVELFRIADEKVVHTWTPDLPAIFKAAPAFATGINTREAYRAQHPLLLADGDLLMSSGEGPLARIDPCGKPEWVIARHFHHSIEEDGNGNFLVPIVIAEGANDLGAIMRDDGFAVVSGDGRIVQEYTIYQPLMAAGYRALIYGVGDFQEDRFHLNDVQPIPGEPDAVLLSIRNLSSIARFNLKTQAVEWLKTGPWLNQHDVNPLPDGRVSIFGNDFAMGAFKKVGASHAEVYVYDPAANRVETPFSAILQQVGLYTEYEGRVRLLANGDLFIEETNRDRLLRLSHDKIRWQYVNGISESTTGALHWSRYLEKARVPNALLEKLTCAKP